MTSESPSASALSRQFVFIIGAPRSGTTWLHRLLMEDPHVASAPKELTWFSRYAGAAKRNFDKEKQHIDRGDWNQGLPLLFSEAEFMEGLRRLTGHVYDRVLLSDPNATHIVDKHPNYARHIGTIESLVSNARYIHLIRDGRDVALSMVSTAGRAGFGAAEIGAAAGEWRALVEAARKGGDLVGAERYMELTYEALKADDGTLLSQVFAFMGIPVPLEEAKAILERNHIERKSVSRVDPDRKAGKNMHWSARMSLRDRMTFNQRAGGLLVQLGQDVPQWWRTRPLDGLRSQMLSLFIRTGRSLRAARQAFRAGM